jgi:hypothetical protein
MPLNYSIIQGVKVGFTGLLLFLTMGCRKGTLHSGNDMTSFESVFDEFYQKMNTNYCYWDIDHTNLDSLYMAYKPRFRALNIINTDDQKKSVSYFRTITASLIDSHFEINFQNVALKDSTIYPALERKKKAPDFRNRYDFSSLSKQYLDSGSTSASYFYEEDGQPQQLYAIVGTINSKILYFSCNRFAFSKAIQNGEVGISAVLKQLDKRLAEAPNLIKGIIIDLRGNAGGDAADLGFMFGRFINEPLKIGTLKYKNGDAKLDYTPQISTVILPNGINRNKLTIPFILLVDVYSASLSEAFAAAVKTFPNGKLAGETTWGATGPLADNAVFNYGGFDIGNLMKVKTAIGQFRTNDGYSVESIGFHPDIAAPFNIQSYNAHTDSQLITCINYLHKIIAF